MNVLVTGGSGFIGSHFIEGFLKRNDVINVYDYPSEPWTYVKKCNRCDSIIFIIVTDRMGGQNTDTVYIYQNK